MGFDQPTPHESQPLVPQAPTWATPSYTVQQYAPAQAGIATVGQLYGGPPYGSAQASSIPPQYWGAPPVTIAFTPPQPRATSLCAQFLLAPFELRSLAALFYFVLLSMPFYAIGVTLLFTFAWLSFGFFFLCGIGIPMFAVVAVFIRGYANVHISITKALLPPRDPTSNVMKYPTLYGRPNNEAVHWIKSSLTSALTWKGLFFYHFIAIPWSAMTSGSVQSFYFASMWAIGTSLFWIFGVNPFGECDGCGGFLKSPASFALLLPVGIFLYWITCCMALWLGYLERNLLWRILGHRVVDRNDFGKCEIVLPNHTTDPNGSNSPLLPVEVVDPTNPERRAVYTYAVPDMNLRDFGRQKKNICSLATGALVIILFSGFVFFLIWNLNLFIRCSTSSRLTSVKSFDAIVEVNGLTHTQVVVTSNLDCPNLFNIQNKDRSKHMIQIQDDGPAISNGTMKVGFVVTTSVVKSDAYRVDNLFDVTLSAQSDSIALSIGFLEGMSWKDRVFLCTNALIVVTLPQNISGDGLSTMDLKVQTGSQSIVMDFSSSEFLEYLRTVTVATKSHLRFLGTGTQPTDLYQYSLEGTALSATVSNFQTIGRLTLELKGWSEDGYWSFNFNDFSITAVTVDLRSTWQYLSVNAVMPTGYGAVKHTYSTDGGTFGLNAFFPATPDKGDVYDILVKTNSGILGVTTQRYNGSFTASTSSGSYNFQQCDADSSTTGGGSYTTGETNDAGPSSLRMSSESGPFSYEGNC